MIKQFWIVWLVYWLLYLIQPIESVYENVGLAWLLQFAFVIVVTLGYFASFLGLVNFQANKAFHLNEVNSDGIGEVIVWGFRISLMGLTLLLYDKVIIQGIDYSAGFAVAREHWRELGESRDGRVSSIFSVFGYLLSGAFFLSLGLTLSRRSLLSDGKRLSFFMAAFLMLMLNSVITGGRSSILLAIAFVAFGCFNVRISGNLWKNKTIKNIFLIISLFLVFYILYIFNSRASAGGVDVLEYSIDFLEYLGMRPVHWFEEYVNSSSVGWLMALVNLAISYLTHSLVTTAAIISDNGSSGGDAIFSYLYLIGAKFGLLEYSNDWFLAGRFPSMPGALYMQFGVVGMLFVAFLVGGAAGLLQRVFNAKPSSIFLFLICSAMGSVLILSPFLFAGDLLLFPSVITGGVGVIFCANKSRR